MLYASTLFTDKFLTNFSETRHEIIPPFHETDTLSYKTPLSKRLGKMYQNFGGVAGKFDFLTE